MSFQAVAALAPYAVEALRLVGEYVALAQQDNPEADDIRALELRWRAANKRARDGLDELRRALDEGGPQ